MSLDLASRTSTHILLASALAYARAAKASMGRPPDFAGDRSDALAVSTHMLALKLLGD